MNIIVYNTYTDDYETVSISFWKFLKALLGFPQRVGLRKYAKWTEPIEFYFFYCSRKGFVIDYPHTDGRLDCEP